MTLLLDTHVLIWLLVGSPRLGELAWLDDHRPWGLSPVSLLEIQFLAEVGKLEVRNPEFMETLAGDARFVIDEPPLLALFRAALTLTWTRDPFDRLLAAHSKLRRVPLCSMDRVIRARHRLLPPQLS